MKNKIFLRRKNKVIVAAGTSQLDPKYMVALNQNIKPLGYAISDTLAERLSTLDEKALKSFYENLASYLKEMVGAHVKFRPMYPNFPKQVQEMRKELLFDINLIHYLGDVIGVRFMPEFIKKKRPGLVCPFLFRGDRSIFAGNVYQ